MTGVHALAGVILPQEEALGSLKAARDDLAKVLQKHEKVLSERNQRDNVLSAVADLNLQVRTLEAQIEARKHR